MHASMDASGGHLLYQVVGTSPFANYAWGGITDRLQDRQRVTASLSANHRYHGGRDKAVPARIFRVHGCRGHRRPVGVTLGLGVVVTVAIAYGGNRTPKLIVVFCLQCGDFSFVYRHCRRGVESRVAGYLASRGGRRGTHEPDVDIG